MYKSFRSVQSTCFLHRSPFYPTPKILYCTVLFNRPYTPELPLPTGSWTCPCNSCSLDPHKSASAPKHILISSAIIAQLTAGSPYILQYSLKCDYCTIKKLIAAINVIKTIVFIALVSKRNGIKGKERKTICIAPF